MSINISTRRAVKWIGIFVAFAAIVAVVLVVMLSPPKQSQSRGGTEATPSAAPAPTSTSDHSREEGDLPELIADNPYDCKLQMTPEEYQPFIQRLMEFEAIRVSTSEDRFEQLTPFATEDFLKTQTDVGNKVVTTVNISMENPSPFGCYMDDSSQIVAYVNPFVTVTDYDTGAIQSQHQPLSTHHTQWIKVGGSWYVNQERF